MTMFSIGAFSASVGFCGIARGPRDQRSVPGLCAYNPERGGATLRKLVDAMCETVEVPTHLFEGEGEREDAFRRIVGQGGGSAFAP